MKSPTTTVTTTTVTMTTTTPADEAYTAFCAHRGVCTGWAAPPAWRPAWGAFGGAVAEGAETARAYAAYAALAPADADAPLPWAALPAATRSAFARAALAVRS